jgi:hypothetical protein
MPYDGHVRIEVNNLYAEAEVLLSKKMDMERLSQLELAVWKHCCRKGQPKPMHYLDWTFWYDSDWKNAKIAYRSSNDIYVILSNVTPFVVTKRQA